MNNMYSKSGLAVFCTWTLLLFCCCRAEEDLDSIATNLRATLEHHFAKNRNHEINPTNKENSINYIKERMEGYKLEVELMRFTGEGDAYEGTNVIGVLPGKGTADDKVLVLGSHFDTVTATPGVDDNGSGMAVFLEAIRLITIETCTNTIVFVAFDLEETQEVGRGLLGSHHFVRDWLVPFLGNGTNSTFQGAIVLETLMNFNGTSHAQELPDGFNLVFSDLYNAIEARNFAGDFVTVVGRVTDDAALMSGFTDQWNRLGHNNFQEETVPLPFSGVPTQAHIVFYGDLFRSDHTSFWTYGPDSLNAIFLTDTANFRGNMRQCYHEECDDVSSITDDKMMFLAKTTCSVANMLKELGTCEGDISGGAQLTVYYTSIMLSLVLLLLPPIIHDE